MPVCVAVGRGRAEEGAAASALRGAAERGGLSLGAARAGSSWATAAATTAWRRSGGSISVAELMARRNDDRGGSVDCHRGSGTGMQAARMGAAIQPMRW